MEPINHFSHNHGLVFLQLPEGSRTPLCSGCKFPTSGSIYVCWQCSYFLHEQCFRASRSLKHPSHPLHPLTLMPFPTYLSRSFVCNSCNLMGDAYSYSCSECEFDIHVHCALTQNANPHSVNSQKSHIQPNATMSKVHFSHPHSLKQMEKINAKACSACEHPVIGSAYSCSESNCTFNLHKACFDSPREIRHESHLHALTLRSSGGFTCDACRKDGRAFAYSCAACCYDIHIDCAKWPETVIRPDHEHALTLYYSSPLAELGVFICDACMRPSPKEAWVYYCGVCDFGTHLECVHSEMNREDEDVKDELTRLFGQKVNLDEIMKAARQNKVQEEEQEAIKKIESEEELRRRRNLLEMETEEELRRRRKLLEMETEEELRRRRKLLEMETEEELRQRRSLLTVERFGWI